VHGRATAGYQLFTFLLSGVNPDPSVRRAIVNLPAEGTIRKIDMEYRGTLLARLRWTAIISDTAPAGDAAMMQRIFELGGVGSHDYTAIFLPFEVKGPPIKMAADTHRILYVLIEHAAVATTDAVATFTVHVDVDAPALAARDHVSL